jgi:hypothetical protein
MLESFLEIVATQNGSAAPEGVSGSLEDMPFTDMIQILATGGKSMKITLRHGEREGHVYLDQGEVVYADLGDMVGREAFYELMEWAQAEFTAAQCKEFPASDFRASAMSLLMDGLRLHDEQSEGQE